jgi:YHS domain-containing protein
MGRLLAWLIEAVVVIVLVRAVMRLFGARAAAPRQPSAPQPLERAGGTLMRDPNCGTYVPASRALQVRSGQETLYFCSATCRDAFTHRA